MAIKDHGHSPSLNEESQYSRRTSSTMNFSFPSVPTAPELAIIQYPGPPPPKARRPQATPRQEAKLGECSLPDLAPNGLFDEISGLQTPSGLTDSVYATFLDGEGETPSPSKSESGVANLSFVGKSTSTCLVEITPFL